MLVLNQPIFYTVKKGDTLSEISWKLTGRKASVRDLKNWNTIWDDNIKPGQVLYLADPNDSFVKEIASKLSKYELSGRSPKVSLDRLSDEMVARHGGLFRENHQVEIRLEYRESPEDFLNPEFFEKDPIQDIPWAPGFAGGNPIENDFDQPHYPDEVRLSGGDFMGMESIQHTQDQGISDDAFNYLKKAGSVIRGGASVAKIIESEYLAQATINNALKGKNIPVPNALKTIAKISKIGGYTGIAASLGIAGTEYYNGTDNTSTWVNAGISTIILASGIVAITIGAPALATAAGVAGVIYGVGYMFYGDKIDAYINLNFGYR